MYNAPTISNPAKFGRIATLALATGYRIEFRPVRHVRGWPVPSEKPYLLQYDDYCYIAAFATLAQLETNLRARNGC